MLKNHFPICIPIKTTVPYPYKDDINLDCLKLLTNAFKKNNISLNDCIIILDGRGYEILSLAQKLGYKNFYATDYSFIDDLQGLNQYTSEWTSINDMINDMYMRDEVDADDYKENINRKLFTFDFDFSYVFVAPINSPFKSFKFIEEISFWKAWERMNEEHISFLTSASHIINTSMFYINNIDDNFQKPIFSDDYFLDGTIRNISKCNKELQCDNNWYFINTNFLKNKIVTENGIKQTIDDQYINLWNESNFSVIVDDTHHHIFINNKDDFKKLNQIVDIFKL